MCLFFFNETATTEIYTLSLHDALPIYGEQRVLQTGVVAGEGAVAHHQGSGGLAHAALLNGKADDGGQVDRKSTRLNSSHSQISYAVFCLKKKKKKQAAPHQT